MALLYRALFTGLLQAERPSSSIPSITNACLGSGGERKEKTAAEREGGIPLLAWMDLPSTPNGGGGRKKGGEGMGEQDHAPFLDSFHRIPNR